MFIEVPIKGKIRLIHDCSRPQHSNVNSYTDTQQCKLDVNSRAPNENMAQNRLNIALLNIF